MTLPAQYAWLNDEGAPRMLVEALKLYGTKEVPGPRHSDTIMGWGKEVGLSSIYSNDEIPWCGLFMAVVAKRATWDVPKNPLWARNWLNFGVPVKTPMLGDVLVYERGSGGHVGIYVGEDADEYFTLGGNQSNTVNISRMAKSRLLGARRPKWRIAQPANVRRITLTGSGTPVSTNEA